MSKRQPSRARTRDSARRPAARPQGRAQTRPRSPGDDRVDVRRSVLVAAIALLAVSIVVFAPGAYFRWVLPKELVALVAVLLASLSAPVGRLGRAFWVIAAVGGAVLVVAALLGEEPVTQLLGAWPRYEGLVAVPVYVAAAWAAARMLGPGDDGTRVAAWHRWVAIASLALGVVSVLEAVGAGPIPSDLGRPGSLLGNASDQGLVAAAFLLMLVVPTVRASTAGGSIRGMLLLGSGSLAALATVLISQSRGALLALAAGGFALLVVVIVRLARQGGFAAARRLLFGGGIAVVALAALVLLTPGIRDRVLALGAEGDRTLADRELMWQQAIDVVARNPWTGAGPSGFATEAARGLGLEWYRVNEPGAVLDSPHNIVFQLLVAGGIPLLLVALAGLALVVVRFAGAWGSFARRGDADARGDLVLGSGVALLAMLVGLLTHFTTAGTGILGGVLVGVVVARAAREALPGLPEVARSGLAILRTVLIGAWAVWMLVNVVADYRVAEGVSAASPQASDRAFADAAALRPWDSTLASIAAQILTARADAGEPGAASLAVRWADRAIAAAPSDVAARIARAVATRADGDLAGSVAQLEQLRAEYPANPDIALQLGLSQYADGQEEAAADNLRFVLDVWPEEAAAIEVLGRIEG